MLRKQDKENGNSPLVLIDLADQKESETFPLGQFEGSCVAPCVLVLCKMIKTITINNNSVVMYQQ